ncbi:fibropellin-1-like [Branchiostoma lanceolatum]|uniref:fibropellin-1-like n=1 Tax=Branchiostoma lanceolatum TaxID=7740 RepID=UPI00345172E0
MDSEDSFSCRCQAGYTGQYCNFDIDECSPDPCIHGSCTDGVNSYNCACQDGWAGKNCSIDVDECASNPCAQGNCTDAVNGFTCACAAGWNGTNCNIDINECESNPCLHGNCTDLVDGYWCVCESGWTGVTCNKDIDECASNPCMNGNCTDLVNSFRCECEPGWTNVTCDEEVDECASNPCVHGNCTDFLNGYSCQCEPGWTDAIHDNDTSCVFNSSVHGNYSDGDNLTCKEGWNKTNCNLEIDECSSNPCQHGTCTDLVASYNCSCESGWGGDNCDQDIVNDCASNPCLNGICTDAGNSYYCMCDEGWAGINCEEGPPTFSFELTISNVEFTEELSDPTSQTFTSLASELSETISSSLNKSHVGADIINVVITSFRQGSVIADYYIQLRHGTAVTDMEIQETLRSALRNSTDPNHTLNIKLESICAKVDGISTCKADGSPQWPPWATYAIAGCAGLAVLAILALIVGRVQRSGRFSWELEQQNDDPDPGDISNRLETNHHMNPLYNVPSSSTAYELEDNGVTDGAT